MVGLRTPTKAAAAAPRWQARTGLLGMRRQARKGLSDVQPVNMPERALSILVYLLAALFFAYLIAVVTDQLSGYVNDPAHRTMDDLNTFARFHKVGSAWGPLHTQWDSTTPFVQPQ